MANQRAPQIHRYRAGIDGIDEFAAIEITGGDEEHEKDTVSVANANYDEHTKGKVRVSELVIKLAVGRDQNAIEALNQWFDSYFADEDGTLRSGYVENLDEAGLTPIMSREFMNLMPCGRKMGELRAEGKSFQTVEFTLQPERVFYL